MAGKPFIPPGPPPPSHYALPADTFLDLCVVRDELQLFAAMSTHRAGRHPEMMVYRNTLAHCFEHLAQQVERIVRVINENPSDNIDGVLSRRHRRKH